MYERLYFGEKPGVSPRSAAPGGGLVLLAGQASGWQSCGLPAPGVVILEVCSPVASKPSKGKAVDFERPWVGGNA
jgi:hypothetical protein